MDKQQKVYQKLSELNIPYEVTNHPAVYTIDEMDALGICEHGDVCKNLFLRNANGKQHYLVVLSKDKQANLKSIREQLGCSALSFASAERLDKYLQLSNGEVTPLGVLNDSDHAVQVVFDRDLIDCRRLGIHPNDNTATVWITFDDLKMLIEQSGNSISYVTI